MILISADAALCIHQRPVEGATNEVGAMPRLIDELHAAYRRTKLFRLVTTDAGNTSLGVSTKLIKLGLGYFVQETPSGKKTVASSPGAVIPMASWLHLSCRGWLWRSKPWFGS